MPPLWNKEENKDIEPKRKAITPRGFLSLTRVYGGKDGKPIKTQPVLVSIKSIDFVRPRNSIGTKKTGNRCTIQTTSGTIINVKQKFSVVTSLLNEG